MQYLIDHTGIVEIESNFDKYEASFKALSSEQNSKVSANLLKEYSTLKNQVITSYSKLVESRNQFADLFEQAPIGYLLLDRKLQVIEANSKARSIFNIEVYDGLHVEQKSFPNFIINGLAKFLDWINNESPTPIEISLANNGDHSGRVKLFQNFYHIFGQEFTLLSLIPINKEHELLSSLLIYKTLFEYAQVGVIIASSDHKIQEVNAAFTKITKYRREEVLGSSPDIFYSFKDKEKHYEGIFKELQQQGYWTGIVDILTKNGEIFPEELEFIAIYDEAERSSQTTHYIVIFKNVRDHIENERNLLEISEIDALTGLLNRKGFNRTFQQMFEASQREGAELTLIFLDLDNFKGLNDRYGHNYGDELLINFAKRLRSGLKKNDKIARLGGDEFVIILYGEIPVPAIERITHKLIEDASRVYQLFDITFKCSASIGIANYPQDAIDEQSLLQAADAAMYQAKRAGKNRFQFFNKALFETEKDRENKLDAINSAIRDRNFEFFLQPQHSMKSGALLGFEALLRWRKKDDQITLPADFLADIENREEFITLSIQLINQLVIQISVWKKHGFKWPVAINLNAYQLAHSRIKKAFFKIAENYPDVISLIGIEVTETAIFENDKQIEETLTEMQTKGFKIFLDDFGTGYASIYSLKKFNFHAIKIDRSFIKDILSEEHKQLTLLDGIIQLLQSMELDIICEGVEEKRQLDYLVAKNCNAAQGYFFEKPLPSKQLWTYIKNYL